MFSLDSLMVQYIQSILIIAFFAILFVVCAVFLIGLMSGQDDRKNLPGR